MKKLLVVGAATAVLFISGCSITTKDSKDDILAEKAALEAKFVASQDAKENLKFLETLFNELRLGQYQQARQQQQGFAQPQYMPQQSQPSVIFMPSPQPQQPRIIYMPSPAAPAQSYPYPFTPGPCGCQMQRLGNGQQVCPCPIPPTTSYGEKQ